MNILLVRPRPDKETIGLQSVMVCEPLELMQLSAVLEKYGHNVTIIDMIIEKKPINYFINKYTPDIIGITGYISHVNIIKRYAKEIKDINKNIKVFVGGVHAEVVPQDFESEYIDEICKSAEYFYSKLGIKVDGYIKPKRDLPNKYRKKYYYLFHKNCALIKTSYGCPYNCNFCFCKEISPYFARPIDEVIEELSEIPQKEIYIVDDDFLFNRKRLLEFIDLIKEKNINKKFLVYGRADFIANNEDLIEKLSEVGLRAVIVGIEAANQAELNKYNKKTKISDNEKAVQILQKYDIDCYATTILGIEWNKGDFKRLYKWLKEQKIVFVNLQPFTPMPKTPYFEQYKNELIIPYEEYEKWDMAHLVVKPTQLSVRQYYIEIIKLYYKISVSPRSVLYMIKKFGLLETLKLSIGATKVSYQYIKKAIRG